MNNYIWKTYHIVFDKIRVFQMSHKWHVIKGIGLRYGIQEAIFLILGKVSSLGDNDRLKWAFVATTDIENTYPRHTYLTNQCLHLRHIM
jgi:hypothetical protein